MKYLLPIMLMSFLGACNGQSPNPEIGYCAQYGVKPGDAEYQNCYQYFYAQQAAFDHDRGICEAEADGTYPPSLYSRPNSFPVRYYGARGGFPRTSMVHVGTDYQHNAQVDALRMRIIGPCMQVRGWNSASDWQAGRHPANMYPLKQPQPLPVPPLPWQR